MRRFTPSVAVLFYSDGEFSPPTFTCKTLGAPLQQSYTLLFVCSTLNSDITESSESIFYFYNFYVGDAGNTPLVDVSTHLGAATAVAPTSAV